MNIKIYKTHYFTKWQTKNSELKDSDLQKAIEEVSNGLYEANLGGNLYKKRVAKKGFGKRSSYRTIIAGKIKDNLWIYIYGFDKSEQANITSDELETFKDLASDLLNIKLEKLTKVLNEIHYEKK